MAEDSRKVTPSLKCSVVDSKITGSHDVEFRISVHIEENQTPTFIELIRRGLIELKDVKFVEDGKAVPDNCRTCQGDMLMKQMELGLKIGVTDTESICKKCKNKNAENVTPNRRSLRAKRKPTKIAETEKNSPKPQAKGVPRMVDKSIGSEKNMSPICAKGDQSYHNSPKVCAKGGPEKIEMSEESIIPDFELDSVSEVNTPATKCVLESSPAKESDEKTLSVRRSSRRSKSRFSRNNTGVEEESDSPFVYFDIKNKTEKKAVKTLLENQVQDKEKKSPASKRETRRKRKDEETCTREANDNHKDEGKRKKTSGRIVQPRKKSKIEEIDKGFEDAEVVEEEEEEDEVLTLHLSDSDKEVEESDQEDTFQDDEDADPDFIIAENVDEEVEIDHDEILKEYLSKLKSGDNIKQEVYNPQIDSDVKVKTEKETFQSNIPKEIEVVLVTVPEVHKEDFPCHICSKSYIVKRYLNRHLNKTGTEPVLCNICDAKFHSQKEVNQHKLVHTGHHPFLCEVCKKCFPNRTKAEKHVKHHLPPHEKPNICPDCGKGFTKEHALREHSHIHAKVKPYQCDKCDAKFAARYLLHAHLKYHSSRIYTCYTCNRVYKVFASLKEHLQIYKDHYTKDEPEPIEKVPHSPLDPPKKRGRKPRNHVDGKMDQLKRAEAKIDVKEFINEEDKDQAESDKKSTKSRSAMFQRDCLKLVSVDTHKTEGEKGVENGIDCARDLEAISESAIKAEVHSEDGDLAETSLKKKGVSRSNVKFPCKICFRWYTTRITLSKHYGKCGRVCYPCNKCEAKFHSKRNRKQHQLLHSGEHSFQCKVCFKSFANLSKCKMHTATHLPTNRKPFSCDICSKAYAFASHLEKHKNIHDKTNFIKCHLCPMSFASKSSHGRHMDVHMGAIYKCDTCEKEYKYPSSLKDHLKTFNHISHDERIVASILKKESVEPVTFMCDICGKCLKSINSFNSHQKIHKNPSIEKPQPEDNTVLKQFALKKHKERVESFRAREKLQANSVGQFQCKECGLEFKLKQSLYRHHSIKHGKSKHQCEVCQRRFFTPSELARHMLTHKGERSFQCEHCPRSFFHAFGLKRHLKTHVAKESLAHGCNVCGKKFLEACYLRDHMRRHTGEKPFKCDCCGKAYITKNLLKQHMISHGPLNYFCELCGKGFTRVSNFNAHMRKHENKSSGYTYLCDDCGQSFTSQSGLNKHKFKHLGIRNFKCEHPGCIKTFFFKQQLKNHQKSHTDNTPYQCDTCGKSFKYNTSFYNHLRSHRAVPPMSCEICGKQFLTAFRLNRHMEHHLGDRTLECDQCKKRFVTQADLNYHKKQHEAIYECQECKKVFKLETRLRTHMRVHLGPDRVKCPRCDVFYKDVLYLQTTHLKFCDTKKICPFCGRKFLNIRKLQSHIGVHTGKRPHECSECGSAFTSLEFLEKHQERHKNKRYPCDLCEKGFNRISDLHKHMELHKKKEEERQKVEEYKSRLLQEEAQVTTTSSNLVQATTSSNLVQAVNDLLVTQSGEQTGQDILALAAASIIQNESLKGEGGAVVQYVHDGTQLEQDYSHVVELETSSIIQDHCVPVPSSEQVILTTIDTSHLSGHEGNEILMVAMIPDQQ